MWETTFCHCFSDIGLFLSTAIATCSDSSGTSRTQPPRRRYSMSSSVSIPRHTKCSRHILAHVQCSSCSAEQPGAPATSAPATFHNSPMTCLGVQHPLLLLADIWLASDAHLHRILDERFQSSSSHLPNLPLAAAEFICRVEDAQR